MKLEHVANIDSVARDGGAEWAELGPSESCVSGALTETGCTPAHTAAHTADSPHQHSSSVLTVWNSFARNQAQIVLLSADSECEYQLQCWYYGEISVSGTSSLSTSSSSSSSSSLSMSVSTSFMNSNFEIDYVYSDCKNPQLSFNETVQSYQIIVIFHTRQKTVFVSTPTTTHIKLIKVRKQLFIMETFLNQEGHLDEKFWKRIKC